MKTMLLALVLLVASLQAISQCDRKVNWYAVKGEMYDQSGNLLDSRSDSIFFETDRQKVTLRFKSDDKVLEGTVKEKICDWKEPFKNGKTIYHTTVIIDGETSNASFTVEARDAKVILWVEIQIRSERKFKIYLDNYEETR